MLTHTEEGLSWYWQWGRYFTTGNMYDTKLLCYVLDNSRTTSGTVSTLDKWISWSLLELQLGIFLDLDPWGRPYPRHSAGRIGSIMDGWRAVLVCHKGDEKYIQKVYKTSHGAVSKNICVLCEASNECGSQMLYTISWANSPPQGNTTLYTTIHWEGGRCGVMDTNAWVAHSVCAIWLVTCNGFDNNLRVCWVGPSRVGIWTVLAGQYGWWTFTSRVCEFL